MGRVKKDILIKDRKFLVVVGRTQIVCLDLHKGMRFKVYSLTIMSIPLIKSGDNNICTYIYKYTYIRTKVHIFILVYVGMYIHICIHRMYRRSRNTLLWYGILHDSCIFYESFLGLFLTSQILHFSFRLRNL